MAMAYNDQKKRPKPLKTEQLKQLALRYVSRYATSQAKLATYLNRKLLERGWSDEKPADIALLVSRFAELGYIDDGEYARNKAASLNRRGYGSQRIKQAFYADGIAEEDASAATQESEARKWSTAHAFAKRKRIGPYAQEQADEDKKRKQIGAFLRAGHEMSIARRFVDAAPNETIDEE